MMKINGMTPILCVESIEKSLPFWTEHLGFTKTVEVPHKITIGFVILHKDASEIMLQTFDSIFDDNPSLIDLAKSRPIWLYATVDSIDQTIKATEGLKILVPLRSTFYGAKEIWVQDTDGNVIGFAEQQ